MQQVLAVVGDAGNAHICEALTPPQVERLQSPAAAGPTEARPAQLPFTSRRLHCCGNKHRHKEAAGPKERERERQTCFMYLMHYRLCVLLGPPARVQQNPSGLYMINESSASSCGNDEVWLPPCTLRELDKAQVRDAFASACTQLLQPWAALTQQCKGPIAELSTAAQVQVRQVATLPHQSPQPAVRQLMAA